MSTLRDLVRASKLASEDFKAAKRSLDYCMAAPSSREYARKRQRVQRAEERLNRAHNDLFDAIDKEDGCA